ncbi:MAG: COX15/CtaA family protein [Bacteroidia bacterium]|nr:COX15/CtaA family protein [Bacteroidia bacterium]MDW8133816.1 COX15/CtaA family protein [Bacteroidia bacterium]
MNTPWEQCLKFRRLALGVFILFFLVIAAGVSVRVLGAGMGCPDWPTCYGRLIPPLREADLPPDYRQRYAVGGRLAEPFDPLKTWVEYINRLLSVLAGLGVILLVGYSWWRMRAFRRLLIYVSLIPLLLIVQAIVGWRVVASYLAEHVITIHMFLSILLTLSTLLAWAHSLSLQERPLMGEWRFYEVLGWLSWVLLLVQLFLGSLVRSAITEEGAEIGLQREVFLFHRSFSWVVLASWAYFQWRLYREPARHPLARRWALWTMVALIVQVILGAIMGYLWFKPLLQVLHLVVAIFAVNSGFISLYFLRNASYAGSYKSLSALSI